MRRRRRRRRLSPAQPLPEPVSARTRLSLKLRARPVRPILLDLASGVFRYETLTRLTSRDGGPGRGHCSLRSPPLPRGDGRDQRLERSGGRAPPAPPVSLTATSRHWRKVARDDAFCKKHEEASVSLLRYGQFTTRTNFVEAGLVQLNYE